MLFVGRDGDAWRLYLAPASWCPACFGCGWMSTARFAPSRNPIRTTWSVEHGLALQETSEGGLEILAKGRSAVTLLVWLEDLVQAAPPRR
jgi:hypothetical protein